MRTGGDAAGGSACGFGSGSAKAEERERGGREGGASEESLSDGEMESRVSQTGTVLDTVAFLRKKPGIASYLGRGSALGEGKEKRRKGPN